MGFSFGESLRTTKRGVSLDIAYKHGCSVCTLANEKLTHPRMEATGSEEPLLYIIGEAPGEVEDREGFQFIGKSGDLIRNTLDRCFGSKFIKKHVRWNNCCNCRPPSNRTPTEFELQCCRKRIEADITEYKPLMVAGFGGVPLQFFIKTEGITNWRGRIIPIRIEDHSFWYAAHLHPAFILRRGGSEETDMEDRTFKHVFEMDIKHMREVFDKYEKPKIITKDFDKKITFVFGKNKQDFSETVIQFNKFKNSDKEITTDIETDGDPNGLSPFNNDIRIVCASISDGRNTFAFPIDHPEAWNFNRNYVHKIMEEYKFFLEAVKVKIAHNSKFELSHFLKHFGQKTIMKGKWKCTQALATVLDERPGTKKGQGMTALGTLTMLHYGFNLKNISNVNLVHPSETPLKDLLPYCGMDSKWEAKLYKKLQSRLEEDQHWTWNHLNELARTLAITESKGLICDVKTAKKFGKKYDKIIAEALDEMRGLKEVKRFEKNQRVVFLPSSTNHLVRIFRDEMNLERIKKTKSNKEGSFSTDKDVMNEYAKQGIKLAELIVQHREAQKQKSGYVNSVLEVVRPDGLLHPEYTHLFVSTGRLSAKNPPIQTFPSRKNKQARDVIICPDDHWIVSIDYAQIEARLVAVASQDPYFLEQIRNDYDIHMDWSIKIAKRLKLFDPDDESNKEELKAFRKTIKNSWTFPLIYGSAQASAEADLGAYEGQLDKEFKDFWKVYPRVKEWQEELISFYREHGYVETLMGRRRHMPMTNNELINMPIQGCLKASSRVQTKEGWVKINELVDKKFKTWTGFKWANATALNRGKCRLAKITLSSGLVINCDTRHKLKSLHDEWKEFKSLKVDDYIALPIINKRVELKNEVTWPYILGSIVGDGCVSKTKTKYNTIRYNLSITGGSIKKKQLRSIDKFLNDNGFNTHFKIKHSVNRRDRYIVSSSRLDLAEKLMSYGIIFGSTAHSKRVPESVWKMSIEDQTEFMRGLWETDGAREKLACKGLHVCNKELLQEVQILAYGIGYDSYMFETSNGYKLEFRQINSVVSNRDFPYEALSENIKNTKYKSKMGDCEKVSNKRVLDSKPSMIHQHVAERIVKELSPKSELYRYDKIMKIEILNETEDTFTLSVEDELHQFVADGVIHKNTASDIVTDAMNRLSKIAWKLKKPQYQPVMNVHDDLTFYIPDEVLEEDIHFICERMVCTPFDFINVPLGVEVSIGKSWGKLDGVITFDTNDFRKEQRRRS